MPVDIKQLRYFIAVAEERSFTRAAIKMHISQPPLSQRIKELEKDVGAKLFDRSTREVELTAAGSVFLDDARQLVAQLDRSVQTVRRISQGQIGRLVLGFVPSAANGVLPPLLKAFRQRYPDVTLALNELSPSEQVERLRTGRLDAAIFYLPPHLLSPFGYADLASEVISDEPLVVIFPEGHPLTARSHVDLAALAKEPFVLIAAHRGSGLRDLILEECRKANFTPDIAQEAALIQTVGGLVASGVGVALVPASLRRLQPTGVDYRALRGEPPKVSMGIVWKRDVVTRILQSFLNTAKELMGTQIGRAP